MHKQHNHCGGTAIPQYVWKALVPILQCTLNKRMYTRVCPRMQYVTATHVLVEAG